jgi:hypothetical protein
VSATSSSEFEDVSVPESNHAVTQPFQVGTSLLVSMLHLLAMRIAIDLDHQTSLQADEIRDVISERMLPAELEITKLLGAQDRPQAGFCCRLVRSHLASPDGVDRIASHIAMIGTARANANVLYTRIAT